MDDAWDTIEKITGQLDAASTLPPDMDRLLRIMVALTTLTPDARQVFNANLARVAGRPFEASGTP
jgi:hypothetical protein